MWDQLLPGGMGGSNRPKKPKKKLPSLTAENLRRELVQNKNVKVKNHTVSPYEHTCPRCGRADRYKEEYTDDVKSHKLAPVVKQVVPKDDIITEVLIQYCQTCHYTYIGVFSGDGQTVHVVEVQGSTALLPTIPELEKKMRQGYSPDEIISSITMTVVSVFECEQMLAPSDLDEFFERRDASGYMAGDFHYVIPGKSKEPVSKEEYEKALEGAISIACAPFNN